MFYKYAKSELELMVGRDEKIFWKGKPDKLCFILEGIFNPLLLFAIIWFLFDFEFLYGFFSVKNSVDSSTLLFFLIHLTPVWVYLSGILFIFRRYKHTEYIVTEKGVYVSGGLLSYTCTMKPFTQLSRVNLHRGVIDQVIGVGDVLLTNSSVRVNGNSVPVYINIADIREYRKVFEIIKKLQEDI